MAASDRDGRDAEAQLDINYLFLRQQTERSRADNAASETARKIHEQLANEYERLIEDATKGRISFVRPRSIDSEQTSSGRVGQT